MNCTIRLKNKGVAKIIKNATSNNQEQLDLFSAITHSTGNVDNRFIKYFEDETELDFNNIDNFNSEEEKLLIKKIKEWNDTKNNKFTKQEEFTTRDEHARLKYEYKTIEDREFCRRHVVNTVINILNLNPYVKIPFNELCEKARLEYKKVVYDILYNNLGKTLGYSKEAYIQYLERIYKDSLSTYNKVSEKKFGTDTSYNVSDVEVNYSKEYANPQFIKFVNNQFNQLADGKLTDEQLTLLSFITEMFDYDGDNNVDIGLEFIKESVSRDSRINKYSVNTENQNEESRDIIIDAESLLDTNPEGLSTDYVNEYDLDTTFGEFDNHDGLSKDALLSMEDDIKIYLSNIPKTKSFTNGQAQYDLDNPLGLVDKMDLKYIDNALRSIAKNESIEKFIERLETVANTKVNLSCLNIIVQNMRNNPDFAQRFYRTYAHNAVPRMRIRVKANGTIECYRYNYKTDALATLSNNFQNRLRSLALNKEDSQLTAYLSALDMARTAYNNLTKTKGRQFEVDIQKCTNNYVDNICLILNLLNLSQADICKYINFRKTNYEELSRNHDNLDHLADLCFELINAVIKSRAEYFNNKSEIEILSATPQSKRENELLIEHKREQNSFTAIITPCNNIAKAFVNYVDVNTEFNSIDCLGKRASDIINDSYFINFFNRISNDVVDPNTGKTYLENFLEDFQLSTQSDYSQLIEHRDEKGNIINKGICYIDANGNYRPCKKDDTRSYDGAEILKGMLFDGAVDESSNQAIKYDKMSPGDYIASTVLAFNHSVDIGQKDTATYFMRTPSDAGKNFTVTMPYYDLGNPENSNSLLTISNFDSINEITDKVINEVLSAKQLNDDVIKKAKEIITKGTKGTPKIVEYNKKNNIFAKDILNLNADTGNNRVRKNFPPSSFRIKKEKEEKTYNVRAFKNGEKTLYYVISGDFNKSNNNLDNAEFLGFINPEDFDIENKDFAYKTLRDEIIKNENLQYEYSINTEHPIYKQIFNLFKQELLDRATAISVIFKVDENGEVLRDDQGQPIFNNGFNEKTDSTNSLNLYLNYHFGPNGKLFNKKNGRLEFAGGNVFKSTKFVIAEEVDGKAVVTNYGQQICDELFNNLIYGGVNNGAIQTTTTNNRLDVVISEEQKEVIDKYLSEFLKNYIRTSNDSFKEYLDFIPKNERTTDKLNNYFINYFLAYHAFDNIFEGNFGIYKNPIDFIKRAKEVQGSGVGYANKDVTRRDNEENKDFTSSPLYISDGKYYTPKGSTKSIRPQTKFRAICINNTIRSFPKTAENIRKALEKEGVNEEFINSVVKPFLDNTKVNDAQSYITLDEWVRRIALRGQFDKYKNLIEKLYNPAIPLTKEDYVTFVQIQKNFYFDHHYNSASKVRVSRQIKNAEMVLVPRFIKGTELEYVADLMEKHNIDQLNTQETSKAANTNILDLWDNEGNLNHDYFDETSKDFKRLNALIDASAESFDYTYLYTQQETKQHINSTNKVSIQLVKKIIDNISSISPELASLRDDFHKLYYANILESARNLGKALGINFNTNGTIDINDNGTIETLNIKEFFTKMRTEARRQSLDSNAMDYITLIEELTESEQLSSKFANRLNNGAETVMPLIMTNLVTKFESLAQSLFNNAITRQKFPGYHGPQTTAIGWQEYQQGTVATDKTYGKRLQYHPLRKDGETIESYIEVLLPRSAFNFQEEYYDYLAERNEDGTVKIDEKTLLPVPKLSANGKIQYYFDKNGNAKKVKKTDAQLLKEIENAGLDKHIILRIPNEGKQSTAIAKCVGFIDEGYGSSIVIPEEWVTQSGSDMDFDSIYSMTYHTTIKKGTIQKYTEDETNESLYAQYVKNNFSEEGKQQFEEYVNDKKEAKEFIKKARKEKSSKEKEIKAREKEFNLTTDEEVKNKLNTEIETLNNEIKVLNDSINSKFEVSNSKFNYIEYGENNPEVISFDEYNEIPLEQRYSNKNRNNKMLDVMIKILSDPKVLKENISTSHSYDIVENIEGIVSDTQAILRANRDVHNIIHNVLFQSEYISGRALKGISVVLDNITSVSNVVHGMLRSGTGLRIIYHTEKDIEERDKTIKKTGAGYSYEQLVAAFGEKNVKEVGKNTYEVYHDMYGWSKDNTNCIGNVLTIDISETTAYMLDIAKLGAITNVNTDTFGIFKLFPSLGSDYNVAVSFIAQPGVSEIVKSQTQNRSIFYQANYNPIHTAIKRIAQRFIDAGNDIIDEKTPINTILEKIQEKEAIVSKVLGLQNADYTTIFENDYGQMIPLDPVKLRNRLKKVSDTEFDISDEEYQAIFDFGTVLQYMYYERLANGINAISSVCKPDSFGAKADIYTTEQVFDTIYDMLDNPNNCVLVGEDTTYLESHPNEFKTFIEEIYPNIAKVRDSSGQIDREKSMIEFVRNDSSINSKYKPLYGFLRFSTGLSVITNRKLFPTQEREFRNKIKKLQDCFTNGKRLDTATHKSLEKYIISCLINQSPYISMPITVKSDDTNLTLIGNNNVLNNNEYINALISSSEEFNSLPEEEKRRIESICKSIDRLIFEEKQRIFGYDKPENIAYYVEREVEVKDDKTGEVKKEIRRRSVLFEVEDINNPTDNEIDNFNKLSPAQKLLFIQQNFDLSIIRDAFQPNLINFSQKYSGRHTIMYSDNIYNSESVYNAINELYFSNNPLFKLTALDLVKYSFIVEGFKMGHNAVNKSISNVILLNTNGEYNSIVDDIVSNFNSVGVVDTIDYDRMIERYIQSHPEMYQIVTHPIDKQDRKFMSTLKLDKDSSSHGGFSIPKIGSYGNKTDEKMVFLYKYDIIYDDAEGKPQYNKYVRLKQGKYTTLYRIVSNPEYKRVYLIPLNNFEENESYLDDFSVKDKNNRYAKPEYYELLIEKLETGINIQLEYEDYKFKSNASTSLSPGHIDLLALSKSKKYEYIAGALENAVNKISEVFADSNRTSYYLFNSGLGNIIKYTGSSGSAETTISIKESDDIAIEHDFVITKLGRNMWQKVLQNHTDEETDNIILTGVKFAHQPAAMKELLTRQSELNYIMSGDDIYFVTKKKPEDYVTEDNVEYSSINLGSAGTHIYTGLRADSQHGIVAADETYNRLKRTGFYESEKTINERPEEFYKIVASHATTQAKELEYKLRNFLQIDGVNVSISNRKVIDVIMKNPKDRMAFRKLLLEADSFIQHYKICTDLQSQLYPGSEVDKYVNQIIDAVNLVKNSTLKESALENYITNYIKEQSDNPLIKEGIITALDGFYATSWMESWFADIQESPNPIIQTAYKEINRNITAAVMAGKHHSKEFVNKWESIEELAKQNGAKIDIDKFIDKNGNLIPRYKPEFLEKFKELRDRVTKLKEENKINTFEYLGALIDLKEFKLKNTEQALIDEYYIKEVEALKYIHKPEFKEVYEKYTEIENARREYIRNHDPENDPDYFDKLYYFNLDISALTSDYRNGSFKVGINSETNPDAPTNEYERKLYSKESAKAIREYIKKKSALNEYYESQELDTFKDTLKKHLTKIREFKMLYPNMSKEDELMLRRSNPSYKEAIDWVDRNSIYISNNEIESKLKSAWATLSGTNNVSLNSKIRDVLTNPKYKGIIKFVNGELDPTTIPEDALTKIRDIQNNRNKNSVNNNVNERTVINNTGNSGDIIIYNDKFYNGMKRGDDSEITKKYSEQVAVINEIIKPYYDKFSKTIDTVGMDLTTLTQLGEELNKLREITKWNDKAPDSVKKFIKENVDFVVDDNASRIFEEQKAKAKEKGEEYYKAWISVNCEPLTSLFHRKGKTYRKTLSGYNNTPCSILYGTIKPKEGKEKEFIHEDKTKAIQTINKYTRKVFKDIYFKTLAEMSTKSEEEYNKWYRLNHVYNPYTHEMEPLEVWQKTDIIALGELNDDGSYKELTDEYISEHYAASFNQSTRKIKKGCSNEKYNKDYGMFHNFKDNTEYSRPDTLNEYEKNIQKLILDNLIPLGKTWKAKRYFNRGKLPKKATASEFNVNAKLLGKFFGFENVNGSNKAWISDEEITYANVTEIDMPFTSILENKQTGSRPKKPNPDLYSEEEYKVEMEKYNKAYEEWNENRIKIHQELLDRDYKNVISDFIARAYQFNAIQENVENLFFTKKMLERYNVLIDDNFTNRLKKIYSADDSDQAEYHTKHDDNASIMWNNYIRRLVYDVWKEDHGVWTKGTQAIQTWTSNKYMMANFYGGINNLAVGWTQMFAESWAKRYFDVSSSAIGTKFYTRGAIDYIQSAVTGKFHTLQGALIDLFDVIDYDEISGLVNVKFDGNHIIKKVRNAMYSPQTATEHAMQNSVLFAMLDSHRLIENPSRIAGEPKYIAVTKAEYLDRIYEQAMQEVLTDKQKEEFKKFKDKINSDARDKKKYAEFRKDFSHVFMLRNFSIDQMKEFNKKRKELRDKAEKEFETKPKFINTFGFDDNINELTIAKDSPLNGLSLEDRMQIFADFSNKVKSVNKKIHGVYDKMGAARVEKTLLGSLAMQYHKHIYPGIMKRYRKRGMFNESRKSIEKGSYNSLLDFLRTPIERCHELDQNQKDSLTALQVYFKSTVDFLINASNYYNILTDYDKENIRRQIGDISGVMVSLLLAAAVRIGFDADDDDENVSDLRGMLLYQADRLDTESFMWNPFGMVKEFKTLYSQPVAAQSSFVDILDTMNFYCEALFDDEFEWEINSGPHSGENKILMRLRRNIPIYRVIDRYTYFDKSNRFYRYGNNGLFQDTIKKAIDGED
uniref:Uncharacterized protein n=1 Tax=Geladintestivirus 1 TaxID=3233133 RepID=A0AAU8MHN4_9CAUD